VGLAGAALLSLVRELYRGIDAPLVGTEFLSWSYAERRAASSSLFQGQGLQAPWALTP
jgi:hypothetical protein